MTTKPIALITGASKGAMDRIVLAAAEEYRDRGITANVINPGATDTGWMDNQMKSYIKDSTFLNRVGQPDDCAHLVEFLCSSNFSSILIKFDYHLLPPSFRMQSVGSDLRLLSLAYLI